MNKMTIRISEMYFIERDRVYFLSNDAKLKISKLAKEALKKLISEQKELFLKNLSEETIKLHYTCTFKTLFESNLAQTPPFQEYKIDFNYNRIGGNDLKQKKEIWPTNNSKGKRFDLVIHRRAENFNSFPENLIHFEFKNVSGKNTKIIENDYERLRNTSSQNDSPQIVRRGQYEKSGKYFVKGYQLGIFLNFYYPNGAIKIFDNGEELINI